MKQPFQDRLRIQINRYIFSNGYAPSTFEMCAMLDADELIIKKGLRHLAKNRAIVLHPNSYEIWVAHPFATSPTLFWVVSGSKKWWGNCAWCSLGIAALANCDTTIFTKTCGEAESLQITITEGRIAQKDLLVHFAIPARRLWDNVIYSCANMLVFRTTEQVDEWCKRHNVAKGQVVPIEQAWDLAIAWYGNYLDDAWTRKSRQQAESIFEKVGLNDSFWRLT